MIEWIQQNLELVLGGTGIAAFISYIALRFTTTIIPKFLGQVQKAFIVIVSNLFGVTYGEGVDMVEKLPAIGKFDEFAEQIKLNNYLKLVDLKKQLNSPLYTELEKINIEQLYDYLFNILKDDLPEPVQKVLDQLDEIQVGD